jgi:hypothetical protein
LPGRGLSPPVFPIRTGNDGTLLAVHRQNLPGLERNFLKYLFRRFKFRREPPIE